MNSTRFICKCGKTSTWIEENSELKYPCPVCGRRYKGIYSFKKLTIEAIEINNEIFKKVKNGFEIRLLTRNFKGIFINFVKPYDLYIYFHFPKITYQISICKFKIELDKRKTKNFNRLLELEKFKIINNKLVKRKNKWQFINA